MRFDEIRSKVFYETVSVRADGSALVNREGRKRDLTGGDEDIRAEVRRAFRAEMRGET